MKYVDFKKHKLFLLETIVIMALLVLFLIGGIYSIIFPVIDDIRRGYYDSEYLSQIYSADKDNFAKIASLIAEYKIESISHDNSLTDDSEKYFYKDTLYYQTNLDLNSSEKDNITALVYEIFDKYDFDYIECVDDEISFSYLNQDLSLIYSKDNVQNQNFDSKNCRNIASNWYAVEY